MLSTAILLPLFTLAGWTALVLLLIGFTRVRAGQRRQIVPDDFKYGESAAVPPQVSIPNRNYMNLLELPVLFYVVCVLLYVSAASTPLMLGLAWAYVALRVVHSLIHLTYNQVIHRLIVFVASNVTLLVLWIVAGVQIFSRTAV